MATEVPDRIEKKILIRAARSRVWRALTNVQEFGSWFGAKLDGPFLPGKESTGKITTPGYDHLKWTAWVERIEPERLFSFRWHPYGIDPKVDYSSEPTTLVEFRLEENPEGTLLTVTESGFDHIPGARRAKAHEMNSQGWAIQLKNIERHVLGKPSQG
jgi:uncharacterized protein YndB with AHSA1/START domain